MVARGKKDEVPGPEEERRPPGESGSARRPDPRSELDGPLAALIEGLEEIVPGLEVLDRELVFEGGARADLAAVDPTGRLFLILLAPEESDRAVLEVLDALRVVRAQLELLVRHFGEQRVNAERAPRVLVVSPASDQRLAERLGALADAGVLVFGLQTVKSATRERAYLVRIDGGQTSTGPGGTGAFLRALPVRLEPLVSQLLAKMERFDEELVCSGDATTLVWRLAGEVLCRVERIGDLLQASVAPRHEPLPLAEPADLEALLSRAMKHLVQVLDLTRGDRPATGPRPAALHDEPILTDEEIQAFRQ